MSQESPARRNGETLPQLLRERPYAVDHATPVAALLLGRTGHFAEPGKQFGDFTPERNINSVNWKRDNRAMGLEEKSATRDCSSRSLVSAVQEGLHVIDHCQPSAQDQNMTMLRDLGFGRSLPWIRIQIIGHVCRTGFVSRSQYNDLSADA